jgi:hypothetical protein
MCSYFSNILAFENFRLQILRNTKNKNRQTRKKERKLMKEKKTMFGMIHHTAWGVRHLVCADQVGVP